MLMKLQALLSTHKLSAACIGSLSFFFFSFFLKQLYKNIATRGNILSRLANR